MTFSEAVKTCLVEKYATFSGRATRSEFWFFGLFYYLIAFVLGLILGMTGSDFSIAITLLLCIPLFIPSIAVAVRRLHDTGRSGWWYFISFLPYIGGIVLLIFFCLKSDDNNKYGPKPKTGMIER